MSHLLFQCLCFLSRAAAAAAANVPPMLNCLSSTPLCCLCLSSVSRCFSSVSLLCPYYYVRSSFVSFSILLFYDVYVKDAVMFLLCVTVTSIPITFFSITEALYFPFVLVYNLNHLPLVVLLIILLLFSSTFLYKSHCRAKHIPLLYNTSILYNDQQEPITSICLHLFFTNSI